MSKQIMWTLVAPCLAALFGCGGESRQQTTTPLADTPANRTAEARRYLEVVPPREMFHDVAENMASAKPAAQAAELEAIFTKHIDIEAFETFLLESLTKVFTAEELRALADFYSSPAGKSVMKKFGEYMAEAMPFIQEQVMGAMQKAEREDR